MNGYSITTVDHSNVDDLGFFCVKNKKHPGHVAKRRWLEKRFDEGLRIKLIQTKNGEQAGFLEYVPWESTWRAVEAPNHLVIHCLWVKSKRFPYPGMTRAILAECFDDAQSSGMEGVVVVASEGPWMAGQGVFLKHGFELVDEAPPCFQLLVRRVGRGSPPRFPTNWQERLERIPDLQLLYADQCPYIGKAVLELPPVAAEHGVRLKLVELQDPAEARQRMPSPYGVVSLVHAGRLLADHPISATRFRNILQRELHLRPGKNS